MIIPIPNQPIDFEPNEGDDCNIGDNKAYCTLYNYGDNIYWQGKQTPCGDNLMCSERFGTNVVLNPDFAVNLNNWVTPGGVFYWTSYGATAATAGTDTIYQVYADLIVGVSYSVTFTVVNRSAGGVKVSLGGGAFGTSRTADGTYTETIVAGSGNLHLKFTTTGSFTGSIVDVIITEPVACISSGTGWAVGEEACHSGAAGDLDISFTPVENTGYYQFIFHINSLTAGSLQVFDASGNYYGTITSNGIFTYYGILQGNGITLTADAGFDGCISQVEIYELRQDIQIHLTDIDGVILEDVTGSLTYSRDRLILKLDTTTIVDLGCYRLAIEDLCNEDSFAELDEINGDVGFDSAGSWTVTANVSGTNPSTAAITGSKFVMTHGVGVGGEGLAQRTYAWPSSGYYICQLAFETGTVQCSSNHIRLFGPYLNIAWQNIMNVDNVVSNTPYVRNAIVYIDNISSIQYTLEMQNKVGVYIVANNGSNTNVIELKSFSIKLAPLDTNTFPWLSNCFSLEEPHTCAKLVEGWENAPDDYGVYRQGFYYPDQGGVAFRLSQRLRQLKFNPSYPVDADDYEFSDGSRRSINSRREKYYDCLFDYMDESAIDALTAEALSGQFEIDGVQYFVKQEDFKPEWDRDGRQKLAQLRMLIRKVTSTIYNSKV